MSNFFLFLCFVMIFNIINSCNIADINLSSFVGNEISCKYYSNGIEYEIFYTPGVNGKTCQDASFQIIQKNENNCYYLATMYDTPQIDCNIMVNNKQAYQMTYYDGKFSDICLQNRRTNIIFICDKDADPIDTINVDCGETLPCEYTLYIKTSNACHKGLSGGWLFVILFFVFFFMYCVIGYLWNVTRSASLGDCKNNIPNYGLWYSLPFAVSAGCKVSYNFIKRKLSRSTQPQYTQQTLDQDLIE